MAGKSAINSGKFRWQCESVNMVVIINWGLEVPKAL
jgi:hypothetical protein